MNECNWKHVAGRKKNYFNEKKLYLYFGSLPYLPWFYCVMIIKMSFNIFVKHFGVAAIALVAMSFLAGCNKDDKHKEDEDSTFGHVLLFYECGNNSLQSYIYSDMYKELPQGYLPTKGNKHNVVLAFNKIANSSPNAMAYLVRYYSSGKKAVLDTIKTYGAGTVVTTPEVMRSVLNYVKSEFPANSYGLVFSSHGSGWLPEGYYHNPSSYEAEHASKRNATMAADRRKRLPVPEGNIEDEPSYMLVRSLGQDITSSGASEMTVAQFASGIPFHLDYILFDMCFTAGAEVCYGLKDKADYIGCSPAEVLGDGMFDYTKITSYLVQNANYDLTALYKDSFERYNSQSGEYQSSTVTLVKTSGLENLASVCKNLFEKYRLAIDEAPVDNIQRYYRLGRHYFYDLYDAFAKCGASPEDLETLESAINGATAYKNATPKFMPGNGGFTINTYSGFSIYLSAAGTPLLDSLYKEEAWNKAVEMVK